MKTSKISRILKLSGTLAKLGQNLALQQIKNKTHSFELLNSFDQKKTFLELAKALGQLKGAPMKIGQMLSITDDLLFPPELTKILKTLQKDSDPLSKKEVENIFLCNFSKLPQEIFQKFEYRPIAAASIGQVHRAQLKSGETVVVKLQYPNIQETIQSDFGSLEILGKILSVFSINKEIIEMVIIEMKHNLIKECNYEEELKNLKIFIKNNESFYPHVRLPLPYEEYCTKNILTLEYLHGDSFEEAINYSQKERNQIGEILYHHFLFNLFQKNIVHADPQNGNYLFNKKQIILFDFGSIEVFSEDFINDYALLFLAIEENNFNMYQHAALGLGIFYEHEPISELKKHFNLFSNIYSPFIREGCYSVDKINPFHLTSSYLKQVNIKEKQPPKKEFLLLDRANLGLLTKIVSFQSEVDWANGRKLYRSNIEINARKKYQENLKSSKVD